ncbi:MAG: methyltransferase [Myxococcota bacterium]
MQRSMRPLAILALGAALSCSKNTPEPTAPSDATPATTDPAEPAAERPDLDLPPQLQARLDQSEAKSKEIAARWTPEMVEAMATLTGTPFADADAALDAVLASSHRTPGNADRDVYRHPKETLKFFGFRPDMKVFEYAQGGGWYTEILAPALANQGQLKLAGYDASSEDPSHRYGARAMELFIESPGNLYEKVELVTQGELTGPPVLGEPDSLDMVMVVRMFHNIERAGMWDGLMPAIHTALAPGGVLGVVQHRAADDADPTKTAPQGYLPEPWLVKKVESYGFRLEARSDINANPKDTKDYEKGVWTLPPTLALGDKDKDTYLGIGESDRSTLKFVKVAK